MLLSGTKGVGDTRRRLAFSSLALPRMENLGDADPFPSLLEYPSSFPVSLGLFRNLTSATPGSLRASALKVFTAPSPAALMSSRLVATWNDPMSCSHTHRTQRRAPLRARSLPLHAMRRRYLGCSCSSLADCVCLAALLEAALDRALLVAASTAKAMMPSGPCHRL